MNKFPKKIRKRSLKGPHELVLMSGAAALLLAAALFISGGGMEKLNRALALSHVSPGSQAACSTCTIYPSVSYSPVNVGGYTYVSYSAYYDIKADSCTLSYVPPAAAGHISGESCGTSVWNGQPYCSYTLNGPSNSFYVGPVNGATTFTLSCVNNGGWNSGTGSASVTVYPSCANSSFGSPWNGNSYLIYSGGNGSISNWYGRYCVHNYSGSAIYIPMATPTEWNNFVSRASAIGIGITSY